MLQYGTIVTATVTDESETEYYAQHQGITFAISKEQLEDPLTHGEEVEGMIYETKDNKKVLQLDLPDIRPGYYGWGTAVNSRHDLGVFVNVGMLDKEVVVSLDDLPLESRSWPKANDQVYLTYSVDERNRFWGHMADAEKIAELFRKAPSRLKNQDITATVFQLKPAGSLVITPEGYSGFIHESERAVEPRLGQVVEARVIGVRTDGGLNLSMNPRAHEAIDDDAKMLMALLEKLPDHFLPLHDKSDPDEIRLQLGISKAQFKRAVGNLMKHRLIKQDKGQGITLLNDGEA